MTPAPANLVRPLGHLEIYSSSRHDMGLYRRVINTSSYEQQHGPLTTPISTEALHASVEAALAHVILEMPSLRIAIADESTSSPCFVAVPSIAIRVNHLEFVSLDHNHDDQGSDAPLMRLLENEHDKLWPNISSRPPWKLTVVQRVGSPSLLLDLVFAVHHSISDGGGTARFHAHLLRALSTTSRALAPPQLSVETGVLDCSAYPLNLHAAQENLVKLDVSWLYLAKQLANDVGLPRLLQAPTRPWSGSPATADPYQTNLRLVTVQPEPASALVSACRAHQTSLTPLLHALVLVSLCRVLPEGEKLPDLSFVAETPISLRPYMTKPLPAGFDEASMTVPAVTAHRHTFPASTVSRALLADPDDDDAAAVQDLVWDVAADVKSTLVQRQATLPGNDAVGLLPYAGDWHSRWRARLGKPRSDAWEISNLGAVPLPIGKTGEEEEEAEAEVGQQKQQPSWRITRTIFSQGANVCGSAFVLSVAGARDSGALFIAVSWQEGVVDAQVMDRFTREFEAMLGNFGRPAIRS